MSDTLRWIQPGWDGLPHMNIKSKKHQARDRPSRRCVWSFSKYTRNTKYNLLRKTDALREKEAHATAIS